MATLTSLLPVTNAVCGLEQQKGSGKLISSTRSVLNKVPDPEPDVIPPSHCCTGEQRPKPWHPGPLLRSAWHQFHNCLQLFSGASTAQQTFPGLLLCARDLSGARDTNQWLHSQGLYRETRTAQSLSFPTCTMKEFISVAFKLGLLGTLGFQGMAQSNWGSTATQICLE